MSHFNRIIYAAISITMLFCSATLAKGPNAAPHGHGAGKMKPIVTKPVVTPMAVTPGATPPGLKSYPYGLMKQGKTPKGWSKGIKTGWRCGAVTGGNVRVCTDRINHKKTCHLVNGIWFCR